MLALKVGPLWMVSSWDKKKTTPKGCQCFTGSETSFSGLFSARGRQLSPLESVAGFLSKPSLLEPGDGAFCLVSFFF